MSHRILSYLGVTDYHSREYIPNSIDLLPIFRDMEHAFGEGMRSVVLTMMLAETGRMTIILLR